jgi:hypothetical protein
VILMHLYQSALLNRAAVEALGFTRDTSDLPGGQFVRSPRGPSVRNSLSRPPSAAITYTTLAKTPGAKP